MPTPRTASFSTPPGSEMDQCAKSNCRNVFPAARTRRGPQASDCGAGIPPSRPPARSGCDMYPDSGRRSTHWPARLASIGAIRFARRSSNFQETVRFYRELVGLPLYETFEGSYGSNGAIFGLPSFHLTIENVEGVDDVAVDNHEQLCLYFPAREAQQLATSRLRAAGAEPVEQHPYWEATGAVT